MLLSHFLVNISSANIGKVNSMLFFQCRGHTLTQLSTNINVETTFGHQHWIDVIPSTLFQRCFVNVETTSINIRWLNFHFQPNFNVEATLVDRRWINVILSMLFQRCFANVETTSINVRRLNFHFHPNINVETMLMNVDDQHCFNVDSTLMCLLGSLYQNNELKNNYTNMNVVS